VKRSAHLMLAAAIAASPAAAWAQKFDGLAATPQMG
jgi:alpha-galactosidase